MSMPPNQTWLRNKFGIVREVCAHYKVDPFALYSDWQSIGRFSPEPFQNAKREILAMKDWTRAQRRTARLKATFNGFKDWNEEEFLEWCRNNRFPA